ncbi:Glutamate carboxypeptidase II [Acidisarcina polymorpha]|uniref:Glutamate carboxypeptidase II n=1 Tax=Acidisarcina polymorpha TaxID=2211140 RepID=A0A2Z5GAK7_9BACT|nr:M28 family metallopeptidase [Acidisarcina polymorpha]AXC15907.1 Glutamate carboxypeptidase II [Acidisarcina polymorpha]
MSLRHFASCCLASTLLGLLPGTAAIAQSGTAPEHENDRKIEQQFLAAPSAKLAGEELKTLSAAPHVAGSKEDYATAQYVEAKFKAAGLQTSIVPYKIWLNLPKEVKIIATAPNGKVLMNGPAPEHVSSDPYQNDPRIVTAFNSSSPSCDLTAEVVYANYGTPEDFKKLKELHVSIKGKLVLVRYGHNYRGVKVYLAQLGGAAGVIIYSDPADDGFSRGNVYPNGPYRPASGVQRGSVGYIFKYPGDATTPGIASDLDLPDAKRTPPEQASAEPTIPATPISWQDAEPILKALGGSPVPKDWQGGLPILYHTGPGGVKVHLVLKQDYAYRTIWDVIGTVDGSTYPDEWVVAGNHRDAWVFGAVDPGSGTAAMLEAVHGIGELLKSGWKPKRKIVFGSWDAEEEGLIGSTEWAEGHASQLEHAVAYLNTDVAVSGPEFSASAVPTLKQFLRDVAKEVPSAKEATVYDQWKADQAATSQAHVNNGFGEKHMNAHITDDVDVGDLGSGSDFTPFFQHLGVPSTDIGSSGAYGVYHSVFDNFAWYTRNADPDFTLLQQQARFFGIEIIKMADAGVLPYDYSTYASEIEAYLQTARKKAEDAGLNELRFDQALAAAQSFATAASNLQKKEKSNMQDISALNQTLIDAEHALLSTEGLPGRPWYKHTIYAPGEFTGYAAIVIPGVNEAIDAKQAQRAEQQMDVLTNALNRAAAILEKAK